jgi:hypothetical protein
VRDLADGVQVGVGFGAGVLLGHLGAEFDVLADRLAEGYVIGHPGLVEGFQVGRDEPVALLVGDIEVTVMYWKPSSRVKRSGPPKDSAVNQVR